jgi:glycosyltransferase involved in cell wall biosynthesis
MPAAENARPKSILVVCPHPENVSPGQRLKYEQYFGHWRANGYTVTVKPFMTRRMWDVVYKKGRFAEKIFWTLYGYLQRVLLAFSVPQYDVVYVFLWVTPFGPPLFERLYRALARKIVYDIDDLVFLPNASRSNRFLSFLKGYRKPFYLMKAAQHVVTCTPFLDKTVRQFNQHTTDISSTINTDTYQPVNTYSNDGMLTLGWSGSHSTVKYVRLLHGALRRVYAQKPFKLLVIGDANFTLSDLPIEARNWVEAVEVQQLQRIDIGLYPLPLDDQWVMGKSGLKALQYMALGIPTVATAIGANFRVMEDGVSGFLVKTEDEWVARILQLMDDPALRRAIGTQARQRVEAYYSIHANAPVYLNILNTVVAQPRN